MKKIINKLFKLNKKLNREVVDKIKAFESDVKGRHKNDQSNIHVHIFQENNEIYLSSGKESFYFDCHGPSEPTTKFSDFAAWIFLPVAMSQGKDLIIHGSGTRQTQENAEKLSDIWTYWLPEKYSPIKVSFTEIRKPESTLGKKNLLLFSGGVDSTYTIIEKEFDTPPDILTIQGMDYKISDSAKFEQAIQKTNILVEKYANQRISIRSNAYDIYKKYDLPPRLTFVFLLASSSFLYIETYKTVTMASDFSVYQQFEALPYGSSIATDQLYKSGDFQLETHGNNVTRAEKLPVIMQNKWALKSLSLCKNKKIRPENCGVCSKCVRTKYMMLATTGIIPKESFIDPSLNTNQKLEVATSGDRQEIHIKATYIAGLRNNNLDKIPAIIDEYKKIIS